MTGGALARHANQPRPGLRGIQAQKEGSSGPCVSTKQCCLQPRTPAAPSHCNADWQCCHQPSQRVHSTPNYHYKRHKSSQLSCITPHAVLLQSPQVPSKLASVRAPSTEHSLKDEGTLDPHSCVSDTRLQLSCPCPGRYQLITLTLPCTSKQLAQLA